MVEHFLQRERSRLQPMHLLDPNWTAGTPPQTLELKDYRKGDGDWYGGPGPYEHDLLCSVQECSEVLMIGWTFEAAHSEFIAELPRVGICRLGHESLLPGRILCLPPYQEGLGVE